MTAVDSYDMARTRTADHHQSVFGRSLPDARNKSPQARQNVRQSTNCDFWHALYHFAHSPPLLPKSCSGAGASDREEDKFALCEMGSQPRAETIFTTLLAQLLIRAMQASP